MLFLSILCYDYYIMLEVIVYLQWFRFYGRDYLPNLIVELLCSSVDVGM